MEFYLYLMKICSNRFSDSSVSIGRRYGDGYLENTRDFEIRLESHVTHPKRTNSEEESLNGLAALSTLEDGELYCLRSEKPLYKEWLFER
jgi:hypothetical protein